VSVITIYRQQARSPGLPAWGGVSGAVRGAAGYLDRSDKCHATTHRPKTSSLFGSFTVGMLSEWVVAIAVDYDILRMRIYRSPKRNHLSLQCSVMCKLGLEPLVSYTTFAFVYQNRGCHNTYNFLLRVQVSGMLRPFDK